MSASENTTRTDSNVANPQRFKSTIARKILLIFGVIVGGSIIIVDLLMINREAALLVQHRHNELAGHASILSTLIAEETAVGDTHTVRQLLTTIGTIPDIRFIEVRDGDGNIFATMGDGTFHRQTVIKFAPTSIPALPDLIGMETISLPSPIRYQGQAIGSIILFSDMTNLRQQISVLMINAGMTSVLILIASLLGISFLQRTVTKPISSLAMAMDHVTTDHDYTQVVNVASNDEIGRLTRSFNLLIDAIREREGKLSNHKRNLEKTIRRRTHQYKSAKIAADKANKAKSDFLAVMSHEIRTPLNGMLVMAEILSKAELSPGEKRHAEVILNSGRNLLTVINDILDFSKIEAGKMDIEKVSFSIENHIDDVMLLFSAKAQEQGLKLNKKISTALPAQIEGDPTRIRQIISNLVGNALKFTKEGRVTIECRYLTDHPQPVLYVAVHDTGMGIPADKQQRIFDTFAQADSATTRNHGGTGLGLSICQKLVTAMGGKIGVRSEEGKGATFWFAVPTRDLADETSAGTSEKPGTMRSGQNSMAKADDLPPIIDAAKSRRASKQDAPDKRPHILIADDNAINIEVLQAALTQLSASITAVEDGRAAVDAAGRTQFDIIFMDGSMPVLDGLAATQEIRAAEQETAAEHRARIIALTANAAGVTRDIWKEAGADDYIEKPFSLDQIAKIVKTWTDMPERASADKTIAA